MAVLQDRLKQGRDELKRMLEDARRRATVSQYIDKGRGITQNLMEVALRELERTRAKEDKVGGHGV